jgi:hypothetical protein
MTQSSSTFNSEMRRNIARVIITCWAAFWVYYLCANLFAEIRQPSAESLKGYGFITAGLLLVSGLTWLTWKRERVARYVLTLFGLLLIVSYFIWSPPHMQGFDKILTALLLGLPLLLSGILLKRGENSRE